ncbi:HAD family hydrolase [Photobacterium lucens]|uniref:HAD family hydrolase n=1 Tax=Photobacterium lucens TaxID=2562949 RepID=UPI00136927E4|nr:HAD family hydrolase [Photobacterium lucens]MBP2701215.1 HAD family hydrolase [Vibrio parahaemolyticus]MZG55076.1 HAD family hydrolase [Photobacterium lucens]MZG79264.1 HAD family hydrolase [Photobacterium lucens]
MSFNPQRHIHPCLAIFDLDETLIAADSASLWIAYMVKHNLASAELQQQEEAMMKAYAQGKLDMADYMQATLAPMVGKTQQEIESLVSSFIASEIVPAIYPDALARIEWHKKRGDVILIISASAEHLVQPIAKYLGVENSIAINLETINGVYTGQTHGVLSFRQGKIERLQSWLNNHPNQFRSSYGYSDSINDLPLLQHVNKPFAVNPDPALALHAQMNEWTIMDWRHDNNILR